ncbi:Gfo/Idh/MocA family oxidoreductase [Fontisphaera persica]|uniref:Gfo/Idh/MocA family protein n=1 Tax=Fontisphaera persica TaxID=2974023 RepID=UPI0024BFA70A|nr:Gfo/Idh/MocA family oxidoreductase [Fontisphaera persica]WCJ59265.1 Gfo/Idh/MocA family oxidoreductase [Fontisphaera persica]
MNNKSKPRPSLSRRHFLRTAAVTTAAFSLVPRHVLGGPRFVPPSEKVNIALVGAGGQGRTNARSLFQQEDAQIIAIADPAEYWELKRFYYGGVGGRKPVKEEIEKHYAQKTPNFKCAEYEDFRVMLEKEKAIDAILCATPDHLHAYVSILAMKMGKHVYCEKPLTHNIWEARMMAKVARETGVATQMGNQGHSDEGIRSTCEWIWDGAIGEIREVCAWTGAGKWMKESGRPSSQDPVPKGLNWDLWLGPREPRPYHNSYAPVSWRSYWDFGTAAIGDMACHNLDPAFMALDLAVPASVEGTAFGLDEYTCYECGMFTYKYPARGQFPPLVVRWFDGGLYPPRPDELEEGEQMGANNNGIYFVGTKGVIICPGWAGNPRIWPDSLMQAYKRPPKKIKRVKGHHRDWLDACKGGEPASANFEYGAKLTEVVLLGTVALRTRKKIYWDAANMKATNAPEADRFLKGTYRKGWELPV